MFNCLLLKYNMYRKLQCKQCNPKDVFVKNGSCSLACSRSSMGINYEITLQGSCVIKKEKEKEKVRMNGNGSFYHSRYVQPLLFRMTIAE